MSLKAGGKSIDMTGIDVLSLYMYCNPQKARDGAIKHSVSTSDAKVLEMIWPADVQRYLGSHSVHGTIRYAGAVASFDIPAVNVVSLTSEADISTDTIVLEAPVGTEDLTATITIQGIGPQGPKGPKGDKMTYADLTQEDKEDLYEGGASLIRPLLATKQNTLTDTDGGYGQRVAELEKGKANIQHQHTVADITDFPELYYDATAFFTSGAYPSDKYEELLEAVKAKRTVYATVDEAGHISYVFFMSSANSDGSSSRVLLTTIFADGSYLYLNTFVLQQSGMTPLQESITGKANKATTLAGYGIGDAYTKSELDALLKGKQSILTDTDGGYGQRVANLEKEGIASEEKLTELEGTLNGEESQQSVDVDTSVHAYVSTSGVKTNTSSTSVSLFEYNLNKGERVKVIGQANANWALLSVKVSENNYTPIVIGDTKVGQTGEYTATEDCTIAFNFWNNEDYSFVKYSRSRGLVETVNKNKEDIADNITRVSSLERIVNDGDWKEKTDIDTSNHKYIKTDGSTQTTSATSVSLAEFQLSAGNSIRVQGVANTTWSFLSKKVSDINYTPIAIGAGKSQTEEYTAEDDCIVAFCFFNSSPYSVYIKEGGLSSIAEVLNSKVDSIIPRVKTLEESCLRKRIEVKKSGGDYNSVTEAINYANSLGGVIDIYIYDGVYDVYAEQGGDAWIATISHSQGERQGLHLADNVNLYGVGHVELRFELPDNITYDQSRSVSCLNLWNSNTIENIDFYAKNCRYAIHDETDGGNHNIKRVVKNCRLEHLGSADGLWQSPTAMGGGASGGSQYDWINCQFITHKFFQAFSYHTNHNETPSHFNIDGCVGLCLEYTGVEPVRSFCAQYYGENHIGKSIFNFKNCTGNGDVVKRAQTADSVDHIEVYNNAYNKITL